MKSYSKALTKVQALIIAVVVIIAIIGAVVTWQYVTPKPAKKQVKVGIIFPLTGFLAPFGKDCARGAEAAIEIFNKEGILKDVEVIPVIADSQSDPTVAASEAERLITVEKVDVIVGSYASSLAMAISQVAERYGVPMFETIAAANELTMHRGAKWTFRFGPAGLYYGYVAVDFLVNELAPKMGWNLKEMKIAIVHEDSPYGTGCADGDEERLKELGLGENIVARERYSARTTDLSPLILKLKELGVDVVFYTGYAADSQLFLRQSYELGFRPKAIIGHSAGMELPVTAEAVGNLIKGVFVVGFPVYQMSTEGLLPEVRADLDKLTEYCMSKYGEKLASWGVKVFTAVYHVLLKGVFKTALEKYGEINRETIRKAFLDIDIPDGGTLVGFGAKFAPPDHWNAGDNLKATMHPVAEWFGPKAEDLIVVWPSELAMRPLEYYPPFSST
ncbi:MAG: hypothetical protein DRO23_10515 [Thermoprotei archaeon]|nr:MAG: hypothetical protein DRO23_10515 [Thermoprotei archaeon]